MRFAPYTIALAFLAVAACNPGTKDVIPPNVAPVADAGSDVTQPADRVVSLDGRASFDPDATAETALTYFWSFDYAPPGSTLATQQSAFQPNNDISGTTSFHPDVVGVYVVELVVNDGIHTSGPAYVVVTATEPESIPVAVAGDDQVVDLGAMVTVDGRQSFDPLGGALDYSWSLSNKPYNSTLMDGAGSITGADMEQASFTPDVTGVFTASLVVSNGMSESDADSVHVTVQGDNLAPVADAGEDQLGEDCTFINLGASASYDPEGAPLSYFWELQGAPEGSLTSNKSFADRTAVSTTFWPDVAGEYMVSVSVFDGTTWSAPALITLTLAERSYNTAPLVDAGADRIEDGGEADCVEDGYVYDCDECPSMRVDLGADGSVTDADDDPYTLAWTIVDGEATITHDDRFPTETILGETAPEEPGACVETPFTFDLTVVDCPGSSVTDQVILTVECCGVAATGS